MRPGPPMSASASGGTRHCGVRRAAHWACWPPVYVSTACHEFLLVLRDVPNAWRSSRAYEGRVAVSTTRARQPPTASIRLSSSGCAWRASHGAVNRGPGSATLRRICRSHHRYASAGRYRRMAARILASREAAAGRTRIVLVTGDAGAGKTALASQVSQRLAGQGWLTAIGRCPEHEGVPAGWPWTKVRCSTPKARSRQPPRYPPESARSCGAGSPGSRPPPRPSCGRQRSSAPRPMPACSPTSPAPRSTCCWTRSKPGCSPAW